MDAALVIDKPGGMTSHDVVDRVRRILKERSVGHLGTLDPMATGVLPLLVGRYTRLAQFFEKADKTYEGEIWLGFSTDTYDATGEPSGEPRTVKVSAEEVTQAARRFVGKIEQMPPPYSAKKIAGVPAYKLARKGQAPELKPVAVEVKRFEVEFSGDLVRFTAQVSAGTYMRTLAHELGQALGCGAHLSALKRTAAGQFDIGSAVKLADLDGMRAEPKPRPSETRFTAVRLASEFEGQARCLGRASGPSQDGQRPFAAWSSLALQ